MNDIASGLAGVATDFADEVGGPPTLGEFLEIVGWSVPVAGETLEDTFPEPLRLTATLRGNKRYVSESASRVAELNDHVFEDAREHLRLMAVRLREESGAPVTPKQFASALLEVLRTGQIALADVSGEDVAKLTAEVPKKRAAKPTPGDLLAIPARSGGYRLAVVLAENRFGTALGLFDQVSPTGRLDSAVRASARRHAVYTDDGLVRNGTWRVVGHDDGLRAVFPADPPIYHRPGAWPGIDTGEHGAAETADGTMRLIDADEAREVDLQGAYRQVYVAAYLQKVLDDQATA
ncbi:hypothetical protein [Lentzea sp. NPDC004782]|uniref:hypothetical protein n=1 Tax=Lentzea sp. NPDC004782 TaxID=3154458 RepID=UPI00339E494F